MKINQIVICYFIVLNLLSVSCKSETNKQCICNSNNESCKIYLDSLSEDSITVFTEKFNNNRDALGILKGLECKSFRCISEEEIKKSEYLIRKDDVLLNALIEKYGKVPAQNSFRSGYYVYGCFQVLSINKYKRQYIGAIDKNGKNKTILIMFNSTFIQNPDIMRSWNKGELILSYNGFGSCIIGGFIYIIDEQEKNIILAFTLR